MLRFVSQCLLPAALGLCLPCAAIAQSSTAMATANALFAASDWDKAAATYREVIAAEAANGLAWQNLGEALLQTRKFDEAGAAFGKAAELKFRPLVNVVNSARVQAEKGDREHAMLYLRQIVATGQGSRMRPVILGASEFARYKDDAQFKVIVESIVPCRDAAYRQFDFWVGDWEVQDPAGRVVGKNKVTLDQEGCLIVENWTSAQGGQTGSSFNYYDVRDKKWHQLYIDNSGNAGAFPAMAGEFKDGKMVLVTDEKVTPVSRWTWYVVEPGRVRQMAEQSNDSQKTWQVTWDSYYVRKGK
ncbi:MAG: tetratricopeptide repeat protein [Betaproteobacteria bacterium]